jgi:hypothetical protein
MISGSRTSRRALALILFSCGLGIGATIILPRLTDWIPYDYAVYVQGARLVRAGMDPHAQLPYWYPLPIVLFTTLPWSFLPDQFAWAFAFIPLGLLHVYYGKRAIAWWLFFPVLINVMFAQAEGWLIFPLIWILNDAPIKASFGMIALMFKPAYGMLLVPYRLWEWWRARRWRDLAWLAGLTALTCGAAFSVDPQWHIHFLNGIARRGDNVELIQRNMTMWAFVARGGAYWFALAAVVIIFGALAIPLARVHTTRGDVLLAAMLLFFPNGLNPVSSMMVLPLAQTGREIAILVIASWIAAGLDILVGGFGGVYLVIVLTALALRVRRLRSSQ